MAAVTRLYARGPSSLVNLSAYGFGLTGLWTATTLVILQFRVLDIVGEQNKATWIGVISVVGLIVAAAVQPLVGIASDRASFRLGKRLPFMVTGSVGLVASTMFLATADTIPLLILVYAFMQLFGNIAQAAANALLLDHVREDRRGAAAGALNLSRAIGSGLIVVAVLFLMGNYDPVTGRAWLWAALSFISGLVLLSTVWTYVTLRPRGERGRAAGRAPGAALSGDDAAQAEDRPLFRRNFIWFLAALTVGTGAVGTLGRFALFFLQDVVGLENPADGGQWIAVFVGLAIAATVYPAGVLSDRVGRRPVLMSAGILGAAASASLILTGSLTSVIVIGVFFGVAAGAFLSVTWAFATDIVPRDRAARTLGFTSFSLLFGALMPLGAGLLLDFLNRVSENLGYDVILGAVALSFVLAPLMLGRIHLPESSAALSSTGPETPGEQNAT